MCTLTEWSKHIPLLNCLLTEWSNGPQMSNYHSVTGHFVRYSGKLPHAIHSMIWHKLVRTYHDLKHKTHRPSIWIPTHLKSELQKVLSSNFSGIQTVRIKFLFYFNSLYKLNLLFSAFDFARSPNTKVQIYNDFNLCQYSGDMNVTSFSNISYCINCE